MYFYMDKLKEKLVGSYRKFKSEVYYQNSMTYLKNRIVSFEDNRDLFEQSLTHLSKAIVDKDMSFFENLLSNTSVFVLPKKIKEIVNKNETSSISNKSTDKEKVDVEELNFFIDGPVELFVLDTYLTLELASKMHYPNNNYWYANRFHREAFTSEWSVNYDNINLFAYYFSCYKKWKNEAITDSRDTFYKQKKDSSIISIDITGYYYHVKAQIKDIISKHVNGSALNDELWFLISVFQNIFNYYCSIVEKYRIDLKGSVFLPVGLNLSCLLGNIYLSDFDLRINSKVSHYGRYVDDIIFVIPGCYYETFDDYVRDNSDLFIKKQDGSYCLYGYPDLVIREDKSRVIRNYADGSSDVFNKLYTEEYSVSEYNLFPRFDANIDSLLNDAYTKQEYIKFREFGNISVNPSSIGKVVNGLINSVKGALDYRKKFNPEYGTNLASLLSYSDLIKLAFKWEKLFFLFSIIGPAPIFRAIRSKVNGCCTKICFTSLRVDQYGDKRKRGVKTINAELLAITKKSLHILSQNAFISWRALTGANIKRDKTYYKFICSYRKSNMMDMSMINYPLTPYFSNVDSSIDLRLLSLDNYISIASNGLDSFKIKYSPSYISLNDYLWSRQLIAIVSRKEYNIKDLFNNYYEEIGEQFGIVKENISFSDPEIYDKNYSINEVIFPKTIKSANKINKEAVYIAVAGIDMSQLDVTYKNKKGSKLLNTNRQGHQVKKSVIDLLNDAYYKDFKGNVSNVINSNKKDDNLTNGESNKKSDKHAVNYILFPESFLPLEWIHLIDKFAKETQSIIVTGIRYFIYNNNAYNVIAVEIPYFDTKYHKQSLVILREKNVMPLFERNIIKASGFDCKNTDINKYYIINKDDVPFAPFVCYETTDIKARSLFKNRINYLFSVEFNQDVNYFQSIGASTSRDLFCYYIECNSSTFGSVSFAPFGNSFLPIASDKGNSRHHMQIIKTNLDSLIQYKNGYLDAYDSFAPYDFIFKKKDSVEDDEKALFRKPSANTK